MRHHPGTFLKLALICAGFLTATTVSSEFLRDRDAAPRSLAHAKLDPLLRHLLSVGSTGRTGAPEAWKSLLPPFPRRAEATRMPAVLVPRRSVVCHVRFDSEDWCVSCPGVRQVARAGDVGLLVARPEAIDALAAARGMACPKEHSRGSQRVPAS